MKKNWRQKYSASLISCNFKEGESLGWTPLPLGTILRTTVLVSSLKISYLNCGSQNKSFYQNHPEGLLRLLTVLVLGVSNSGADPDISISSKFSGSVAASG